MNYNNEPQSREELLERLEEQGWEVYEDGSASQELRYVEDDGHFHLEHFGVRACPDLMHGQGSSRRDWDREVNQWVRDLGYSFRYRGQGVV